MSGRTQCRSLSLIFALLLTLAVAANAPTGGGWQLGTAGSRRNQNGNQLGLEAPAKAPSHSRSQQIHAANANLRLQQFVQKQAASVAADQSKPVRGNGGSPNKVPKSLISRPVIGISSSSNVPECVLGANLKMAHIEAAVAYSFQKSSARTRVSLGSPTCDGKVVSYPGIGKACSDLTATHLMRYYRKCIRLMLLGATTQEAFGLFLYIRVLASNLKACYPRQNLGHFTAFPDSYAVLNELYELKLIDRLRASKRLCDVPDSKTVRRAERRVDGKMKRALRYPLFSPIDSDSKTFLPSNREMSAFSKGPISQQFLMRSVTRKTLGEKMCDAGMGASDFFLHRLRDASNPYENCCSFACRSMTSDCSLLVTSLDFCCKICNRHHCYKNTGGKVEAVAKAARLFSVVKRDMIPCIYTFVV